jgi:hypothetical protein
MNSPYPAPARSATTFEDMFQVYAQAYNLGREPRPYAVRLYRRAQAVAAEFGDLDLWDYLEPALRHSSRWYSPGRGPFDRFFETNLREGMRKAAARQAQKAASRARHERSYAEGVALRRAGHDDVAAAYRRWSRYLLSAVSDRLDPQTNLVITMRLQGAGRGDIAKALGVTEKTFSNRFGPAQLTRMVHRQVRRLVLELPDDARALLVGHLLDEVGLAAAQVERLLGVPVGLHAGAPVLGEEAVLEALGWSPKNPRELSVRAGVSLIAHPDEHTRMPGVDPENGSGSLARPLPA